MANLPITSITELKKAIKKSGIRVFAIARITNDDNIAIEVKKSDFLKIIKEWPGDRIEGSNIFIDENGDIII